MHTYCLPALLYAAIQKTKKLGDFPVVFLLHYEWRFQIYPFKSVHDLNHAFDSADPNILLTKLDKLLDIKYSSPFKMSCQNIYCSGWGFFF